MPRRGSSKPPAEPVVKPYGCDCLLMFFLKRKVGWLTMQKIKIRDDYIKLGQALKLAGLVGSGVEAKIVIQDGQVKVNGQVETQRGKKLVVNDTVEYNGNTFELA